MKRKIVKQGAATLMVSLPSKWAKEQGIGKGDEIDITEEGNSLVISKEQKKVKKETTITITSETESSIRTIVTSAYRLGYDKINIKFQNAKSLQVIKEVVKNYLLGFELIRENSDSCEIENITEPSLEQFENILSKVFLNVEQLITIVEKMRAGKKEDFQETEHKIIEFDNFCRRVISKYKKNAYYQLQWGFHTALNHGQRELYYLATYLEKNKVKTSKEISGLLEQCKSVFSLLNEAYRKKDIKLIEKIHEINKGISSDSLKKGDPVVAHHLLNAIRNFYLASSPLTGVIVSLRD